MKHSLTWIEISKKNVLHNVGVFRRLIGDDRILCCAVKANAYGHGLTEISPLMLEAGADWLGVNALFEAIELRDAGIEAPIYIMGYISLDELSDVVDRGLHFVVYNPESLEKLSDVCRELGKPAFTHLKLETGNNRQGVLDEDLEEIAKMYKHDENLRLEGVATHFANVEDTTDHSYAEKQLSRFQSMIEKLEGLGLKPKYRHCANSAATMIFPQTHFNFVRTGVSNYGLWPSSETYISALEEGKDIELKPVLTWKTKIAQVKKVPAGSYIGYGCTFKTTHDTRLAVLPVGYYDGYRRKYSNCAYVVLHGKRAPVRGRVAMNMIMVDVTHIPEAKVEDEVILLGADGDERVSAEDLAVCAETINYEITTQINDRLERRVVE